MADSKRQQVKDFIQRKVTDALYESVCVMSDRAQAEAIRLNINQLASRVAWTVWTEYSFLELADIMEWKRSRVRR